MAVLILGADGFIGRALRARLSPHHSLVSVDQHEVTPLDGVINETTLVADLGNPDDLVRLIERVEQSAPQLDAIVHLAAYYDFQNRDDPRYHAIEDQLSHLLELLDARFAADAPFIYASSMATLPSTPPGEPMDPDTPGRAHWAYPRHKLRCEAILNASESERTLVQLVLAGVYSDQCELVPLYQQIKRVHHQSFEAMFYPGPTDRGLTYVHRDDTAEAFALTIDRFGGSAGLRERLMVAEDAPVTYREIHDRSALALHGRKVPLWRVPRFLAWLGSVFLLGLATIAGRKRFVRPWMIQFAGEHYEIDSSKTQSELQWRPRTSLRERLTRILEFAGENRRRFEEINDQRPW